MYNAHISPPSSWKCPQDTWSEPSESAPVEWSEVGCGMCTEMAVPTVLGGKGSLSLVLQSSSEKVSGNSSFEEGFEPKVV